MAEQFKGPVLLVREVARSPVFKFIVGPEREEFLIHKGLVSSLSPVLERLVNNGMREAIEGCVIWDDCDPDTFARFFQYAYTGDYKAADPEIHLDHTTIATEASIQEEGPPKKKRRVAQPVVEEEDDDSGSDSASTVSDYVSASETDGEGNEDTDQESSDDGDSSDNSDEDGDSEEEDETREDEDEAEEDDNRQADASRASVSLSLPFSFSKFQIRYAYLQRKIAKVDDFGPLFPSYAEDRRRALRRVAAGEDRQLLVANKAKFHLIRQFLQLNHDSWASVSWTAPVPHNKDPCEVYEEFFLSHARIFVLADKYQISPLMALASNRIYHALRYFTIHQERVQDLVSLVRYTYENTPVKSLLRDILAHYMACVVEDLKHEDAFDELMSDMGDFSADMVHYMTRRFT